MTDVPERIWAIPALGGGWIDDMGMWCREKPQVASAVAFIRAPAWPRMDDAPYVLTEERIAFVLWKADADRAAPNVGRHRTRDAFAAESAETRERWLSLARAVVDDFRSEYPTPPADTQEPT